MTGWRYPFLSFSRRRSIFYRGITPLWGEKGRPNSPVLKGQPRTLVGFLISTPWGRCQILFRGRS